MEDRDRSNNCYLCRCMKKATKKHEQSDSDEAILNSDAHVKHSCNEFLDREVIQATERSS